MKIQVSEFSLLSRAFKSFKAFCGTTYDYVQFDIEKGKDFLRITAGTDSVSMMFKLPQCALEEEGDKTRATFAASLGELASLLDGKSGAGEIDLSSRSAEFKCGKFKAKCPLSSLLQKRGSSEDDDLAVSKKKGTAKKNVPTTWSFRFPEIALLQETSWTVRNFVKAFSKVALDDQTRSIFSQGANFGIRMTSTEVQFVGYDNYHIGCMTVPVDWTVSTPEPSNTSEDFEFLLTLNKDLAKSIKTAFDGGDYIQVTQGRDDNGWLVINNQYLFVATRQHPIRFSVDKVLKHVNKSVQELFVVNEVKSVYEAVKRAQGRATATLTTSKQEVTIEVQNDRTTASDTLDAKTLSDDRIEMKISALALADCLNGLKGGYRFLQSDKFIKIESLPDPKAKEKEVYQFLVAKGVTGA